MKAGWKIKTLGEVSKINYGYTESASSEPIGSKFLRITDIQDDGVNWETVPYCKIETNEITKYQLIENDIVFARTGATTGKSFLIKNSPPEAVFASYLIRLRLIDNKLLPEFLFLFFQSAYYWQSIKDGTAGSAQGGFNATKLAALSISIPPLPEQKRLVTLLDEAFESIATSKANAQQNLKNARALFESHLQDIFAKRGEGWEEKKLGKIADVQSGGTPLVSEKDYWSGEIAWYSSGELNNIYTTDPQRKITQMGLDNSNAKLFPTGSLLIGMYDTAALKMSILDRDAGFNQAIAGVKPNEKIEVEFILHAINANKPSLLLERRGVRQKNLSLEKIKDIAIPLPNLNEQRAVISRIHDVMTETQRLEALYSRKIAALDELKKELLHRAFSGEL